MAEYSSLAALRRALTSDNADERATAYGDVLGVDDEELEPSDVLDSEPSDATVSTLQDADIVPAGSGDMTTGQWREQVLEQLEDIEDAIGGQS